MPTSQLRLPSLALLHRTLTPLHYPGPLPRSITPVHYTGPLHRSITPVHYTGPLHRSITPVHYTCLLYKESLAEIYKSVPRKYSERKQLYLHCHLGLVRLGFELVYCQVVKLEDRCTGHVYYQCTVPVYSTGVQYRCTVRVYTTGVQYGCTLPVYSTVHRYCTNVVDRCTRIPVCR